MLPRTVPLMVCLALALLIVAPSDASARRVPKSGWYERPGDEQQRTELWTAIVQAGDGHILYLSFLKTNLGLTDGHAGLAVSITGPDGEVFRTKRRYGSSAYAEDKKKGVVSIEKSTMKFGRRETRLKVVLPDFEADLVLKAWGDSFQFGDSVLKIDEAKGHFAQYQYLIPRADVSGSVSWGGAERRIEGAGYFDHVLTNRALPLWSRKWYFLTAFADDLTVVFMSGSPLESHSHMFGKMNSVFVYDRSGVVFATRRAKLKFRKADEKIEGYSLPKEFRVEAARKGDRLRLAWGKSKMHDPYIVLEQLSWAIRQVVAAIIGNPVFFRFHNGFELELTLDGKTRTVKGRGLHQIVGIHPD